MPEDSLGLDSQHRALISLALRKDPALASMPELVERLRAKLLSEELTPEERELLARSQDEAGPAGNAGIDDLVELRIRRALYDVCDAAGDPDATLPRIVVARGDADVLPDERDDAGEDRTASDAESIDATLGATFAGRSLAHSLGLDVSATGEVTEQTIDGGGVLVLTDRTGGSDLAATFSGTNVTVHRGDGELPRAVVRNPQQVEVLEVNDALDEIQRVLLWSVPTPEREGLLRKAVRGFSLEGVVLAGKYKIGKELGRGGFGTVYQARDLILETNVAIKVLNPRVARRPAALRGFLEEAQRLTSLDHPNIVRWITFDRTADGLHYFVMEFLDGEELTHCLKREGALDPQRAGEIILQVLGALRQAHTLPDGGSLLHLDLKPQNVFRIPESASEPERIKVIDFGISRFSRDDELPDLEETPAPGSAEETRVRATRRHGGSGTVTAKRVLGGTVMYASPEQCKHILGDKDIVELDSRTDIYSLGVMAFVMLTGEQPFPKPATHLQAAFNHLNVPPFKVNEKNPKVPRKLAAFVDKCLAKDRDERWPSTDEAYEALDRILHPAGSRLRIAALVAASVIVAASIVWAAVKSPPRAEVAGVVAAPGVSGPIADVTVKLRSEDTARFEPAEPVVGALEGLALVGAADGAGESRYFRVRADESGEFVVEPKPAAARAGAADELGERVKIVWEQDGLERASPPFTAQFVPALEWPEGAEPLSIFALDAEDFRAHKPILVAADGLRLTLELADPHGIVKSALFAVGGSSELPFRPVAAERAGDRKFECKLESTLCADSDLDTTAEVRLTDVFGDVRSLGSFPLRLTAEPTSVRLDEVLVNARPAIRDEGQVHRVYLDPERTSQAVEIRLRGRLGAAERGTEFALSRSDDGSALALSETPLVRADGSFEVAFSLSSVADLPTLKLALHASDRAVAAVEPGGLEDEAALTLRFAAPPRFERWLTDTGRAGRDPIALVADAVAFVAPGEHELRILPAGLDDDWLVRIRVGEGEPVCHWIRHGAENTWPLPLPARASNPRLQLDFYSPSTYPAQVAGLEASDLADAVARAQLHPDYSDSYEIAVRTALELDEPDFPPGEAAWGEPEIARLGGASLSFASAARAAPLASARYALYRDGRVNPVRGEKILPAGDGTFELAGADWLGELREDGSYELLVTLADQLGHEREWRRAFTLNRRAPTLEVQLPTKAEWIQNEEGLFELRVKIEDGNGIDLGSVRAHVDSEHAEQEAVPLALRREPGRGAPVEASAGEGGDAGPAPVRAGVFFASVGLDVAARGTEVTVRFEAADALGRRATVEVPTRVREVRRRYPSTVTAAGARMKLLQPTSPKGTYLFNEHGAAASADVKPYRAALAERNVHYAAGGEFDEALFEVRNRDGKFLGGDLKLGLQDIRPFYLDEQEVSRELYGQFLAAEDGYRNPAHWAHTGASPSPERAALLSELCARDRQLPIYDVTWSEAAAYAAWAGKRLPTYVEWEYAVRGESAQRLFACERPDAPLQRVPLRDGGQGEFAVHAWIGRDRASPVRASEFVSAEGLYHLCGNVAEWTSTPYEDLRGRPLDERRRSFLEPRSPAGGAYRAYWVVGADFRQRSHVDSPEVRFWPRYDFKAAEVWDVDDNAFGERERGMPHVGFRCAVDADVVVNR